MFYEHQPDPPQIYQKIVMSCTIALGLITSEVQQLKQIKVKEFE